MTADSLLVRETFDTAQLVAEHPPRFRHPHKKQILELTCPPEAPPTGALTFSRWRAIAPPSTLPERQPEYVGREDIFAYEPAESGVEWYLNFADPRLFVAYAGPLLAQDELQVLEHPALASLGEALVKRSDPRYRPLTVEHGPTPVLVRGVERRCALALDRNLEEGRPLGLYGNRFAQTPWDVVRRAVRVLRPPTVTNIIAMSAIPGGNGAYSEEEIRETLLTAYTGFRAAVLESREVTTTPRVVIHTGHWGTGAFGGNRVLMAMLQILAARLAEVDRLVFHTVDPDGTEAWEDALRWGAERAWPDGRTNVDEIVQTIVQMGFVWGQSDGN